jgi:hypothetical protein
MCRRLMVDMCYHVTEENKYEDTEQVCQKGGKSFLACWSKEVWQIQEFDPTNMEFTTHPHLVPGLKKE